MTKKKLSVPCWRGQQFKFLVATTALIVIDMQQDFLNPDVVSSCLGEDLDSLQPVVPKVRSVLEAARKAGLTIILTREGYSPDLSDVNALKRATGTVGKAGPIGRFLIRGERGQDFIQSCQPQSNEAVIDKPGFSCFFQTGLEEVLRNKGITHLVIVGVTTQCCILSTVYSAVDRGFFCLILQDSCGAFRPADHKAALTVIQAESNLFGKIADTQCFLDALLVDTRQRMSNIS